MGNCINLTHSPQKKITVPVNGGEEKFKASSKVRKITSGTYKHNDLVHFDRNSRPLPPNTKLLPPEVYLFISPKDQLSSEVREPQKVKIVVTRKQLEILVKNAKDFHISKINPKSSWKRDGYRKWQPSLDTIQEY